MQSNCADGFMQKSCSLRIFPIEKSTQKSNRNSVIATGGDDARDLLIERCKRQSNNDLIYRQRSEQIRNGIKSADQSSQMRVSRQLAPPLIIHKTLHAIAPLRMRCQLSNKTVRAAIRTHDEDVSAVSAASVERLYYRSGDQTSRKNSRKTRNAEEDR